MDIPPIYLNYIEKGKSDLWFMDIKIYDFDIFLVVSTTSTLVLPTKMNKHYKLQKQTHFLSQPAINQQYSSIEPHAQHPAETDTFNLVIQTHHALLSGHSCDNKHACKLFRKSLHSYFVAIIKKKARQQIYTIGPYSILITLLLIPNHY